MSSSLHVGQNGEIVSQNKVVQKLSDLFAEEVKI